MTSIRAHRLAIVALDAIIALAVLGALVGTSLLMYRGGAGIFPGGNEGRVVFAALTAAVAAHGLWATLDNLVDADRENWLDVIQEQLVEAAQTVMREYNAAAAQGAPEADELMAASLRAQAKALKAGADYEDLRP
ncbi:hypothetical protein [Streptomyces sp. NPDC017993]|uniref:hypothetical protein n=1 Tax=Streptomyces sp. NPDC017993 TaxID=3365027 RepID=UPI00379BDF05